MSVETKVLTSNRDLCWKNRDTFFACLDANNENKEQCKKEYDEFKQTCLRSWVDHFEKKRIADKQKAKYNKVFQMSPSLHLPPVC